MMTVPINGTYTSLVLIRRSPTQHASGMRTD
jgi:hypothetical protein